MGRFKDLMDVVLKWEGGFVDNPFDNGGPTNMGITHQVLARWRGVSSVSANEVKNLTKAEAVAIFKDRYWSTIKGTSLPIPIDLIVMDGAVNHGTGRMTMFLQEVLGVDQDGDIGEGTLSALAAQTATPGDLVKLAIKLAERRKKLYVNHEDAAHFLKGWRNRLNDVMSVALAPLGATWTFVGGSASPLANVTPDGTSTIVRPVIEDADLQHALAAAGLYTGPLDGQFGPNSTVALDAYLAARGAMLSGNWLGWPLGRKKLALGQLICDSFGIDVGRIDGLFGPRTEEGFVAFNRERAGLSEDNWRDALEGTPSTNISPAAITNWPTEAQVPQFFGQLGDNCTLVQTKRLHIPWTMKLAWDLGKTLTSFNVHEKVHDSAARVFEKVYAHYGDAGIKELGLDLFGGCTSCRKKKGGTAWSMHSWSIAIDFDPERNQLSWSHTRARLAKPDAVRFWELWEEEGWVSLGRAKDFDWMHVQAAIP
jgi:lysozyme family protein